MQILRDPFLNRLLAALAVYVTLVGLWMHGPRPLPAPPHGAAGGAHAHR